MNQSEPTIDYKAIGKRLRDSREAVKLTQAQLGEKLSKPLTATAISLYESGERAVSLDVLTEIANILKTPLEFLIKGKEQAPSINIALRADKDLSKNPKAIGQIESYISYIKSTGDKEK
ncbi:helix-turn-helix transcriptional regulator [Candidatus Roizmanbacteria bacterium]|nr:helix-turn-helix transcriptional regulator [Candidatus Roizmanbacteria bacterium]